MPDRAPNETATETKMKYTSAEAQALYLEQLKKTHPNAEVRKIIQDIEQAPPGRRRRRGRGRGGSGHAQAIA